MAWKTQKSRNKQAANAQIIHVKVEAVSCKLYADSY